MIFNDLSIVQTNVNKSQNVSNSLLNDPDLEKCAFLLLTEPWSHTAKETYSIFLYHSHRQPFFPSQIKRNLGQNKGCFRAMIWAQKDIYCRQVPINYWDITAVITELAPSQRKIFIVLVYIPCSQTSNKDRASRQLFRHLDLIRSALNEEKSRIPDVELIVTGDFNRWDSLWGGNQIINHPRQGESEQLIQFMADFNLQSVVPQGTITYPARGVGSTIDLIFVSKELVDNLESYKIYPNDHGSDHEFLQSTFLVKATPFTKAPRLLFKEAPWRKICEYLEKELHQISATPEDLDLYST